MWPRGRTRRRGRAGLRKPGPSGITLEVRSPQCHLPQAVHGRVGFARRREGFLAHSRTLRASRELRRASDATHGVCVGVRACTKTTRGQSNEVACKPLALLACAIAQEPPAAAGVALQVR